MLESKYLKAFTSEEAERLRSLDNAIQLAPGKAIIEIPTPGERKTNSGLVIAEARGQVDSVANSSVVPAVILDVAFEEDEVPSLAPGHVVFINRDAPIKFKVLGELLTIEDKTELGMISLDHVLMSFESIEVYEQYFHTLRESM